MHSHDEEPLHRAHQERAGARLPRADESGHARSDPKRPLDVRAVLALQRSAGNSSVSGLLEERDAGAEWPSLVHRVVGSAGGQPLDTPTRTLMESRMGADFSDVRIHTDPTAAASAREVNARAYTSGSDIVFGAGQYQAGSPTVRRTLAHELTHVLQQRSGAVDGTPAPGGIRVSDPSDRFERAADANAARVASVVDDAETVQMLPVQRQEDEEAEESAEED